MITASDDADDRRMADGGGTALGGSQYCILRLAYVRQRGAASDVDLQALRLPTNHWSSGVRSRSVPYGGR